MRQVSRHPSLMSLVKPALMGSSMAASACRVRARRPARWPPGYAPVDRLRSPPGMWRLYGVTGQTQTNKFPMPAFALQLRDASSVRLVSPEHPKNSNGRYPRQGTHLSTGSDQRRYEDVFGVT